MAFKSIKGVGYIKQNKLLYAGAVLLAIPLSVYLFIRPIDSIRGETLQNMESAMMAPHKQAAEERMKIGLASIILERTYKWSTEKEKNIQYLTDWLTDRHYYEKGTKAQLTVELVKSELITKGLLVVTDGTYEFTFTKLDDSQIKIRGINERESVIFPWEKDK